MAVLLVFPLTSLLFCSVPSCLKKYIYVKSENQNYGVPYVWIEFSILQGVPQCTMCVSEGINCS